MQSGAGIQSWRNSFAKHGSHEKVGPEKASTALLKINEKTEKGNRFWQPNP